MVRSDAPTAARDGDKQVPVIPERRGTSPGDVAQRVSYTTTVCAHTIKGVCVAHMCRAAAGLPPPSPLDDRRAMASWARMARREQETSTSGCVA